MNKPGKRRVSKSLQAVLKKPEPLNADIPPLKAPPSKMSTADIEGLDFKKCSQAVTSVILGVSKVTLQKWFSQGAPKNEDSSVDIKQLVEWKISYEVERAKSLGEGAGAREKLEAAKITKMEIEIARMRNQTVLKEDAQKVFDAQAVALKDFLMNSYKLNVTSMMSRLGVPVENKSNFVKELEEYFSACLKAFTSADNGEDYKF